MQPDENHKEESATLDEVGVSVTKRFRTNLCSRNLLSFRSLAGLNVSWSISRTHRYRWVPETEGRFLNLFQDYQRRPTRARDCQGKFVQLVARKIEGQSFRVVMTGRVSLRMTDYCLVVQ